MAFCFFALFIPPIMELLTKFSDLRRNYHVRSVLHFHVGNQLGSWNDNLRRMLYCAFEDEMEPQNDAESSNELGDRDNGVLVQTGRE